MEPRGEQTEPAESREPPDKLRAYLQLFRLPNVFTAIADAMMGYLFVRPTLDPWQYSAPLILGSALMYTAGMVINDVADVEIDRVERPSRPLPSGRIAVGWAYWLGREMLTLGVLLGILAAFLCGNFRPALIAVLLAGLIMLYNLLLKSTIVGPFAMGGCRVLNVLLGMSAAGGAWTGINYLIAVGIGLYIVGVSWIARGEADENIHRGPIAAGTVLIAIALLLLAWYPHSHLIDENQLVPLFQTAPQRWSLVWIILAATIFWRAGQALVQPHPFYVQLAVKHCLLTLITIDAVITYALRDFSWAVLILVLVVPMTLLGRWSYST